MDNWSIRRSDDRLIVESQGSLKASMRAWQCGPCPVHVLHNGNKQALPSIPLSQMGNIDLNITFDDIEVTVKYVKQKTATTSKYAIDERVVTAILNMVKLFAEEELENKGITATQEIFDSVVGWLLCRAMEVHLMN